MRCDTEAAHHATRHAMRKAVRNHSEDHPWDFPAIAANSPYKSHNREYVAPSSAAMPSTSSNMSVSTVSRSRLDTKPRRMDD